MSTAIKNQLSSDNLYHFKANPDIVKLILKNGFQYRMWAETVPYKKSEQHNFMVCFCDLRIEDAKYHRDCYGNNAIVLTKEWGINNGISPVRYVHQNSPGITQEYMRSKNRFRRIKEEAGADVNSLIFDYAVFSVLNDEGKLHYDSIEEDMRNNPSLGKELEVKEKELNNVFQALNATDQNKILTKYFRSLYNRFAELHNELERRDSFIRNYIENFTHPASGKVYPKKVLYDEREWRSIKYSDPGDYKNAVNGNFLPEKYNLKFSDKDVLAILVQDDTTAATIKHFLANEKTLLDPTTAVAKVQLMDTHSE